MSTVVPLVSVSPGGLELSQLVYGTWKLLDDPQGAAPAALAARLEACVELGMTTIDTAEIYGRYEVEERLGAAFRHAPGLRDRLQVVSKLGIYVPVPRHPDRKVAFYDASAARVVKSAEKSLRLLGTDRLDLLLVHRPDWLTAADDTADGLERLIRAGKIRAAGVSNYHVHQFALLDQRLAARLRSPAPALVTNQVELSLFQMAPLENGVLDDCQARGVRPMAWSPLGGGRLFRGDDETAERVRRALEELMPKYDGAPPEALALAWILAHPSGPLPVIGTNRIDRIRTAARAAAIRLAREDWYALWTAARGHRIP